MRSASGLPELAAKVELLEADNARLREALESIYAFSSGWGDASPATTMGKVARDALKGQP